MKRRCSLALTLAPMSVVLSVSGRWGHEPNPPAPFPKRGKGKSPLPVSGRGGGERSPQDATPPAATTDDPSNSIISQLHIFFLPAADTIQVTEFYVISNVGDATYVGRQEPGDSVATTLAFTLPEGASNLGF